MSGTENVCSPHPTCEPKHLSGKELILATKQFTQESPVKSWWAVLSTLLLLALATAGTLLPWALPFKVASSVLMALLMVRMFVIYHDHQHHAILNNSKAAEALMNLLGVLLLAPSSTWKASHNTHHNNNSKLHGNHVGSFPIMTRENYAQASWGERLRYHISRHPLTIFGGYLTAFIYAMCLQPFVNKPIRHWDGLAALVVHALIWVAALVFGGWQVLLLTLVLPFIIAGGLGCYLFYAQHNFPDVVHMDKEGWTYHAAALESSSYLRLPKVLHWFTANIGFHHVHHLNHKIPFYRLPEAMKAMPELQHPRTTSLNPLEIVRCLRLKVWDVEKGRMTRI